MQPHRADARAIQPDRGGDGERAELERLRPRLAGRPGREQEGRGVAHALGVVEPHRQGRLFKRVKLVHLERQPPADLQKARDDGVGRQRHRARRTDGRQQFPLDRDRDAADPAGELIHLPEIVLVPQDDREIADERLDGAGR